jgi:predicted ester cyclase
MRYAGRCHCGNITVAFEPARPPADLQLRACGCTFCRRHGQTSVTDPAGAVEIALRDPAAVSRYRFAQRTADFLVCRACGVFVAAVCTIDGNTYATLNVNVLDDRAAFTRPPESVSFEGESAAERMARRRRAWTPAVVREGSPALAPGARPEGPRGTHERLVRAWYEEMWNRWDETVFGRILDPDVELRGSLGRTHRGYDGIASYMRFVRDAFPDFHNEIDATVEDGAAVFARLRYTATHRGPIFGIAPTGRRIEYAGAALFRFRDERIWNVWVLGDVDGLKRQLADGS